MIRSTCILLTAFIAQAAVGQPYPTTPGWTSGDTQVSTGAALVDLDHDGWLDIVVANGNDIYQQRVVVYYNQGNGVFPAFPDWQSNDIGYNGHLDVADVNGDGWQDVAVAHLGEFSTFAPIAKVYLNNAGTLSSTPDWQADIDGNAFGVAFGDANNDGRPDLAVATGWAYSPQHFYPYYVYFNVGGTLEATASWESDDLTHYQGALWVDADEDGWLDLAGAANGNETLIYRNLGGTLETTASWTTTDSPNQDAIMLTAGDVDQDGHTDLFVADNNQLAGGSGRFKQYSGIDPGLFQTTYSWSYYDGYCSAVALADVDADGLLDLATGAWWDRTRIFLNNGSGFSGSPSWNSAGTSVVEKIVFGDVDPACGIELILQDQFVPTGNQRLYYLSEKPIQSLISVTRDGVELASSEYTFSRDLGWLTVDVAPTQELEVEYAYSHSLDMLVTNWDSSVGNFMYYNLGYDDCNDNGVPDGCDIYNGTSQDTNGNGVPDECEDLCTADLTGDNQVNIDDIFAVLGLWGACPDPCPPFCTGDLTEDCFVNIDDIFAILGLWGPCD